MALPFHEPANASPSGHLLVAVNARAAWSNPPLLGYSRHFCKHETGSAHSQLAKVHEMEIAWDAPWLGRVHVHRRHGHAIFHDQLADAEWREHWRRRRL